MNNARLMRHNNAHSNGAVKRLILDVRRNIALYVMLAIPLAHLIIFKYIPMYGVQIAFKDYNPVRSFSTSKWIGLYHIERFVGDYKFWDIISNTLLLNLYSILTFPAPIIFALMLNYSTSVKMKKTVQMISYAPHFISTVVMVGIILQFLDLRSGLLNIILQLFGIAPKNFIAIPEYFRTIYVLSGMWQGTGYASIIYISALSGVSTELHEAAIVDGASIMKRIIHIDIPSIATTVIILLIMQIGNALNLGYEKIYLMQNSLNISVSEVISTYVYKNGLASSTPQFSYASAIGLFVSLINLVILIFANYLSRKVSEQSLF